MFDKQYRFKGCHAVKVDKLIPNQAMDVGFEEGCKLAVYATSNRNMAICFALGCVANDPADEKEASRTMMPEFGDKMVFDGCHPNYGGKGYLYKLLAEHHLLLCFFLGQVLAMVR